MRKTALICLVMSLMCSLSACSGYNGNVSTSIIADTQSVDSFAKLALTNESYQIYQSALIEQEKRSHYVDIEEQVHEAWLKFNTEFSEAYNLGIIDADGKKTGKVDTSFNNFFVEYFTTKEELEGVSRQYTTKEELLGWLKNQRWITEGTELSQEDSQVYLDVMLSEFTLTPGKTIGFTKESLEAADYEQVLQWLLNFYDIESRNVNYYRQSVAKMSQEELQARVDYLLTQDFEHPYTDNFISVIDNRHVLTENTIYNLGIGEDKLISLKVMNQNILIDVSGLGKRTAYGESFDCKTSEDGTMLFVKVNVNGKDEEFNLMISDETNKVNMSVYDIYRILGMKVYV